MSDEVLIQTIRSAMQAEVATLDPPADLLERVPAPRRSWRLAPLGWVGPAVAVAIAVVVAVVAATSLSHRAPAPQGVPASVPPAARGLASRLAVLRGPQRPDDVLPGWAVRETESLTQNAAVVGGLSRLVGAVHLGQYGRARVYLVVQRPPHFPIRMKRAAPAQLDPRLGDQATLAFVGPFREEAAINGQTVAAGGDTVAAKPTGLVDNPGQFTDLWGAAASIVPDGVMRVKWVFRTTGPSSRLITVWPVVRDNVAIGDTPRRVGLYMASAVWYGARGKVISSFGVTPKGSSTRFKRALEASLHQRIDPALLRHFALLRTSPRRAPGLTEALAASLIEPNPLGLNIYRSRFVDHAPAAVFVIPGTQGIALRWVSPGTGQAEGGTEAALSGQLTIEAPLFKGHRLVIGLAPDGNRTVTVLLHGGGRRSAEVTDNVYSVIVPGRARTVVLRSAAGRTVRLRVG